MQRRLVRAPSIWRMMNLISPAAGSVILPGMACHVLIIPDKFKGTLSATAAAEAMADGWHRSRPQDRLELLPMSDGGDGFGEVLSRLQNAQRCTTTTVDAAHRRLEAGWWWDPLTRTAIIESAKSLASPCYPRAIITLCVGYCRIGSAD